MVNDVGVVKDVGVKEERGRDGRKREGGTEGGRRKLVAKK